MIVVCRSRVYRVVRQSSRPQLGAKGYSGNSRSQASLLEDLGLITVKSKNAIISVYDTELRRTSSFQRHHLIMIVFDFQRQ